MNDRSEFERVLSHWLEDGPSTMPDRLVDIVARRISVRPQRRTWRLLRRSSMSPTLKYGIATAAVLIIAIVGYNVLPRTGSIGGPGPSPTTSPVPSPTSGADATAEAIACENDFAGCAGTLAVGHHTSTHLQPALSYDTTGEWLNVIDLSTVYKIDLPNPDDPYVIVWTNPIIAELTPLPACGVNRKQGAGNAVNDWIAMLQAHAALVATTPVPINLGGSSGQSIEVTVAPNWKGCPFAGGYAVQFILDEDPVQTFPYGVLSTQRMLLDIVDVNGHTVIIQVYGPVAHDQFLAATARTRALIDTFRFTPAP